MTRRATRVAVIGASGYAGIELLTMLDQDDRFTVVGVVADRWRGTALGRHVHLRGALGAMLARATSEVHEACEGADVALLATPAEVSLELAPELLRRGVRVVDLSGAFRLQDPAAYRRWYGAEHTATGLLSEAAYGLPEVPEAVGGDVATARLVANPGCYATAAIVALAPLLRAGLIEPNVYVDGKSGVTGAGRKVEERLMFTEVDENLSAYRVGNHQHTPEIEQALGRVARKPVAVTFTPHLLPVRRGLLVTAYAPLAAGAEAGQVASVMASSYEGRGAVQARAPGEVTLAAVTLTNLALVAAHGDGERRSVVALGALDNLRKGAASQAMQNLCAMVGETFAP